MNPFFPEINKNFGFGMMRLPMNGDKVDIPHTIRMVDAFMAAGLNYFDTAHGYISGQSETAIRECVSKRYPRDQFILTNKLSEPCFEKEEDIRPLFQTQLEACGVEYFDFYLMHAMTWERHKKYKQLNCYEIAKQLKAEGKIRHIGFSFHDSPENLEKILNDCGEEIEVVQLQFNYADYEDTHAESKKLYEICVAHNKPVIVMEPVKGGSLVNLPQEAVDMMAPASPASYAIRFAAGFDNICMVLSGMSNMEQMEDNLSFMVDYKRLSEGEMEILWKVLALYQAQHRIPCTACRYCVDGCPAGISIPDLFNCLNDKRQKKEDADARYAAFEVKADACLECGACEQICPQNLQIRQLLKEVDKAFA